MSNEEKVLNEVYSSFKDRLSFEDFKTRFDLLPNDKWNFARAVLLFQQHLKCKDCNPNVGMVLLCSCADALQLVGDKGKSKENFRALYLRYCPSKYRTPPITWLSKEKTMKVSHLTKKPSIIYTNNFVAHTFMWVLEISNLFLNMFTPIVS